MGEPDDSLLRAKYLDWSSARVAERFLDLSAEEIYALAHPSAGEPGDPAARLPAPGHESYRVLVQRATEALLGQMSLPPFEEWRRQYEASPERFDAEMLGFWRDPSGGGG
jgi:hypothetical protein